MTQEQALAEFQLILPHSTKLKVMRERSIGYKYGAMNQFYLWDYTYGQHIVSSSNRSWEHALAIAKSGNEDCWTEDDSPVGDEVSA